MDDLKERVFAAGVVGCGGAGFPTHVKLANPAEYFVVNAAECEPLLRTDRHIMLRHAGELVETAEVMARHLGARRFGIAVKKTYAEEIERLEAAKRVASSPVELYLLDNFYPAGDEQIVVQRVTGKNVPPGGLPLDVGAVVSNAATVVAVHDAIRGVPLTHKYLTVAGDIESPAILRVPVGTSAGDCLRRCGWTAGGKRVIAGGPLMGKFIARGAEDDTPVTKTTSGLVVVSDDSPLAAFEETDIAHTVNRARAACIQCSMCTQLCPRHLLGHPLQPHRIMRSLGYSGSLEEIPDDDVARQSLICCECGVCELYACPMQLQPRRVNILLKQMFARRGVKYRRDTGDHKAHEELDLRLVPGKRVAARAGILEFYDRTIERTEEFTPGRVTIPLRQHIGAPSLPVVREGDRITPGQLVGRCPGGQLGANIHCGVAGRVFRVDDSVTIDVERA